MVVAECNDGRTNATNQRDTEFPARLSISCSFPHAGQAVPSRQEPLARQNGNTMNLLRTFLTAAAVAVVATVGLTGVADASTQSDCVDRAQVASWKIPNPDKTAFLAAETKKCGKLTPKPYTVVYGGYYSGGPHTLKASCADGDTRTATKLIGTENLLAKKQTNSSRSSTLVFTVKPGTTAHPVFTISCTPGNDR